MQSGQIWNDAMKRFRMSTLMLLIVIAALCVALVLQNRRAARLEAELEARLVDPFRDVELIKPRNADSNTTGQRNWVVETSKVKEGNRK
jgi:hypothetical protein